MLPYSPLKNNYSEAQSDLILSKTMRCKQLLHNSRSTVL